MRSRRVNPNRVKLNRIYTISELAACYSVHKHTVRNWQVAGLAPVSTRRPILFDGSSVRVFLAKRYASRKRPCPPGTLYCFKCREPRAPALGMVEAIRHNATSGNLNAICEDCGTVMHRRVRLADISAIMPGMDVQIREVGVRLTERIEPSLNYDD